MKRKIIKINEAKCNGCGLCAQACHEGAIEMVDGVAKLVKDDYCDGLGDCLPACPTGAITFEEREAAPYDEEAVKARKEARKAAADNSETGGPESELFQWPVQLKLIPSQAPFFQHEELLIAADCTAFAYGNFHREFIRDKITVIGCPKLDGVDYTEKLTEIISMNDIPSVTVVRMEVPCCGGIETAARNALEKSGKDIPLKVLTITIDGEIQ
ncbi:MAG: 4Fe-4S binding protein [Eubacteriaceae bacterium]|nr:4Fe-4S binding protein [Eubacteriaceae bacterium]